MIFEVVDMHAYYGKSHILNGVTFSIEKGEAAFILGRNGVGKSTTLLSLMGMVEQVSGSVLYKGFQLVGKASYEISRLGLGLVPETRRIFSGMSVEENLQIAIQRRSDNDIWDIKKIYSLFPILSNRKNQEAVTLSGGEQQMLTIARTLMGNPEIILIDEPTEGLAPLIVKLVKDQLNILKEYGVTMIICDDSMELAREMGDKVLFMEKGEIKWGGSVQELTDDDTAIQKYLCV